jgi:hypothetical protein
MNHPLDVRTPEDTARYLEEAIKELRAWGVSVRESSRIAAAGRLVRAAADAQTIQLTSPNQAAALVDALELSTLVHHLGKPVTQAHQNSLNRICSDPLVDRRVSASAPGRDAQFELFIAGWIAASQTSVCIDEPDVIVETSGLKIPIAIKRVRSLNQMRKKLTQASLQVENGCSRIGSRFGMAVIGVSAFAWDENSAIVDEGRPAKFQFTPNAPRAALNAAAKELGDPEVWFQSLVATYPHLGGVLTVANGPVVDRSGGLHLGYEVDSINHPESRNALTALKASFRV